VSGAAPEESARREADRATARRCAAGDPVAQRMLYDEHIERVERLVVSMIGGGADAADVVQDVFFRIFRSIGRFRGDAELATWVSRITVNEVRRKRRGLFRFLRFGRALAAEPQRTSTIDGSGLALRDAERILGSLPPEEREVYVLVHRAELSLREASLVLERPVSTLHARLERAREKVAARVAKEAKGG
jgi:RNA polymerase sigma-70 factor (ECF subfamily)